MSLVKYILRTKEMAKNSGVLPSPVLFDDDVASVILKWFCNYCRQHRRIRHTVVLGEWGCDFRRRDSLWCEYSLSVYREDMYTYNLHFYMCICKSNDAFSTSYSNYTFPHRSLEKLLITDIEQGYLIPESKKMVNELCQKRPQSWPGGPCTDKNNHSDRSQCVQS